MGEFVELTSIEARKANGSATITEYVLIDYENVQPADLALVESGPFQVKIFVGPTRTTIPKWVVLTMQKSRGEFIEVTAVGNNAADFHIAYYLGIIASTEPEARLHVISKDTGFDPLIQHLRTSGRWARRSECIREIPSVKEAEKQKRKNLVKDACEFLSRVEVEKRPKTVDTLRESLSAHFKQADEPCVEKVIEALKCRGYLAQSGGKIEYLEVVEV